MIRFLSVCACSMAFLFAGCNGAQNESTADHADGTGIHSGHEASDAASQDAATAELRDGVQEVRITVRNNGYEPERIALKEGVPARLVFVQEATSSCAANVQVPDFQVERTTLPQGEETVVEFTPDQTGQFSFVCGMEMLSGTLLVRS